MSEVPLYRVPDRIVLVKEPPVRMQTSVRGRGVTTRTGSWTGPPRGKRVPRQECSHHRADGDFFYSLRQDDEQDKGGNGKRGGGAHEVEFRPV